jgi:glycerol-3-phosphate O-acyltransferase
VPRVLISDSFLGWVLSPLLVTLVVYEIVRSFVVRRLRQRVRRGATDYLRRHRLRLESARFLSRVWMREALLMDPEIEEGMVRSAREKATSLQEVRSQVETYLDEIVPAFNVAAYYRFGAALARTAVEFAYEVVFDRRGFHDAMAQVPTGAVPVFVINHRSNADFIVLSYGLLRHVALSYAVGEWALVWPLDVLFRAFGSYFVRRGEKDPLYHKVLERYVQVLVGHGGVTGFFIEGRLSRDGALGKPKSGLLDYIIGLKRSQPDLEIAFIPVGLNFDRVLEDQNLLRMGGAKAPSTSEKLSSFGRILTRLPRILGAMTLRVASKSHRNKYGYAALQIGRPVLLSEIAKEGIWNLPREERRPQVDLVAQILLQKIAEVVPATPVPLFCAALVSSGDRSESAVTARVQAMIAELRAAGAPVLFGRAFPRPSEDSSAIPELDRQLDAHGEAELVVVLAGFALERRGLIRHAQGHFTVMPESDPILRYYAKSIAHHRRELPTLGANETFEPVTRADAT